MRIMSDTHTHIHANTPCGPTDVETFLKEAEEVSAEHGKKLTRIRRKVLRLLFESPSPAKAYDLLTQLDGEGAAKPPTVYRALEFLQSMGLVHKIESLNAYVACGHTRHEHSAIFLICNKCGSAEEIHTTLITNALKTETEAAGYKLDHAVIETRGTCRDCTP